MLQTRPPPRTPSPKIRIHRSQSFGSPSSRLSTNSPPLDAASPFSKSTSAISNAAVTSVKHIRIERSNVVILQTKYSEESMSDSEASSTSTGSPMASEHGGFTFFNECEDVEGEGVRSESVTPMDIDIPNDLDFGNLTVGLRGAGTGTGEMRTGSGMAMGMGRASAPTRTYPAAPSPPPFRTMRQASRRRRTERPPLAENLSTSKTLQHTLFASHSHSPPSPNPAVLPIPLSVPAPVSISTLSPSAREFTPCEPPLSHLSSTPPVWSPHLVSLILHLFDVRGYDWTCIAEPVERVWGVRTCSAEVLLILRGNGRVRGGGVWWD